MSLSRFSTHRIVIHYLNEDSTRGDKADNLEFINTLTYIPLTGSPANLLVTKQVTGDRANLTQLFDFTLTLTPHTLAPLPETITTRIVGTGDITVDRPVTRTGNVFTFQLLYNERLELFYLLAGTTFAVLALIPSGGHLSKTKSCSTQLFP